MRLIILVALIFLAIPVIQADQVDEPKKNKLVEFEGFDEWEIWCIDIAQSGSIECNLNQVLRYKDHPDFRALILRFYSDGKSFSHFKLDKEWQTSLSRGYIQVDKLPLLSLQDCGSPCTLESNKLAQLTTEFAAGNNAIIFIHDYVVQEFTIDIELDQFTAGAESLHRLTSKYR